jgi:flagellar protein FlaG
MTNSINVNLSANTPGLVSSDKSGHQTALLHSDPTNPLQISNAIGSKATIQEVEPLAVGSEKASKNILTPVQQKEAQHTELEKQAQKLRELSQLKGWSVDFSIDQDLHQTVVKVIDNDTKKVIRQIPSEDVLALSKRIQALQDGSDGGNTLSGLLFDRQI